MRIPTGLRTESKRTPFASRAGALHSHIHSHIHMPWSPIHDLSPSAHDARRLWITPGRCHSPSWMGTPCRAATEVA